MEPGYSVVDDTDEDIASRVEIRGTVDVTAFGKMHRLVYYVQDRSGKNAKPQTRKVFITRTGSPSSDSRSPRTTSASETLMNALGGGALLQSKDEQQINLNNSNGDPISHANAIDIAMQKGNTRKRRKGKGSGQKLQPTQA